MSDNTVNKIEGTAHEIKGAVQEKLGRIIRRPKIKIEGQAENAAGKMQKKVGDAQKVIGK